MARDPVGREVDAPDIPGPLQADFALGDRRLKVVCVDNVVPTHVVARAGARARLVYVADEIAHFECDGHRYAIVGNHHDRGAERAGAMADGVAISDDIRGLLTSRELQIVQLICMGCLTKQVSDRLRISEFTVRSYLKTIYCKLGVRSRAAMVYRYAQSFRVASEKALAGGDRSD
jgi:DNA-binding CsgD family transcriptional regulator